LESLYELFFELSNETRLELMKQVSREPKRLTELSRTLDLPAQEISRQLSRLDKISITWKDVDGLYHLTPYGQHILELLPGYMFLTQYRDYFRDHTIEWIPAGFKSRIGELDGSKLVDDVMMSFHYVEEAIRNSEQYIWIMSDQILLSTMPLLQERLEKGVFFRLIVPKDIVIAAPVRDHFTKSGEGHLPEDKTSSRFTDEMGVVLIVSEKELALAAFPAVDGGFDYKGFRSNKENCIQWGRELFETIWSRSTSRIPEQIQRLIRRA
jgi:predicted transcriptional regulator